MSKEKNGKPYKSVRRIIKMNFREIDLSNKDHIREMSKMAMEIVREHFDPIIGKEQNDYMLERFQSVDAIRSQLKNEYRYFFVSDGERKIGFVAFYPKGRNMYLSKFYLYKQERGKGHAHEMLSFIMEETKKAGLDGIELNVNKHNSACRAYDRLGFEIIRSEKNDIGNGFYMDDYVYYKKVRNLDK